MLKIVREILWQMFILCTIVSPWANTNSKICSMVDHLSFTEKVKHRSDFWYHKYWWETIVHSILDLHKYCTGIRYGIVVLVSANVTCCMSHKAHKVRTIRYHTSQKDSLRAPLHITITVSYKIFFHMHHLSGLRCYFWILLRLGRLN